MTRELVRAGAEVDATTQAYGGPSTARGLAATSYYPARAGLQLELVETLLNAGACVDGAPGGWNPLVAAFHNGHGEAAAFLAERGARLDLEGAAGTGRLEAMACYINEDGALKGSATKEQLSHGFIWACEYGHASVVKFLLGRGFPPDSDFMYGETGLHWAAYGGHAEIAELLLQTNPAVNAKDRIHGGSPLGWAVYGWATRRRSLKKARHHEVIALLIRAGARVERQWLESSHRGSSLAAKLRTDPRMRAVLGFEK